MHVRKIKWLFLGMILFSSASLWADDLSTATDAINAVGLDLLPRVAEQNQNVLISPYSIQSALAMTYAGASGETKAEMAKVLHYPSDETKLHASFFAFSSELRAVEARSVKVVEQSQRYGGPGEPLILEVADCLYGQREFEFRTEFLSLMKSKYEAAFQAVDFKREAEKVRLEINQWVARQTREKIHDLIPAGAFDERTRLALVNAVYFKAPWAHGFSEHATKAEPFFIGEKQSHDVPTMIAERNFGYAHRAGVTVVVFPYVGDEMQLLILMPDAKVGLANFEKELTPAMFIDFATVRSAEVSLHLPKFKLEPPALSLVSTLKAMGMRTAFDEPQGSANFDRMAPRKPNDYLALTRVFHKAFISVDEQGTEATAATAVAMASFGMSQKPKPIEVRINRPFLFAIQHRASGACLFLGRVVDPR